jgi:hypothetical protein
MTAQAIQISVWATATAAFFSLPRPNRRASRRNRAPGRVAVRDTVHADSTSAVRRCWLPLRAAACLRLPADSLSPGASPAQAASRGGGEPCHVAACLGHDHLRRAGADAGDRDQPGDDGGERLGRLGDQDVQLSDAGGEMIVGVQVQPAHLGVGIVEPAVAGHLQRVNLGAQPLPGQVRQHAWVALAGDQRLDHVPARHAQQLAGHRVDLDPGFSEADPALTSENPKPSAERPGQRLKRTGSASGGQTRPR